MSLLIIQFLCYFQLTSSTISNLIGYKIVINPSDLQMPSVLNATYPPMSNIECSSIVLNSSVWMMFCIIPDGSCLVSNATYPANYNDTMFQQSGYNCYATEPPLINPGRSHWNRATFNQISGNYSQFLIVNNMKTIIFEHTCLFLRMVEWQRRCWLYFISQCLTKIWSVSASAIGPCPSPFELYYGSCLYTPGLFTIRTFYNARLACRAYWAGADVFSGHYAPSTMFSYCGSKC